MYIGQVTSHELELHDLALKGIVQMPHDPVGIVLFAHSSGTHHFGSRNSSIASTLNSAGLATLLIDLLTPAEEQNPWNIFDIDLLAERVLLAVKELDQDKSLYALRLGLFGTGVGAAAALLASTREGIHVNAIVSLGGRPDLAGKDLPFVTTPTLFIVGGNDDIMVELNQQALAKINASKSLCIVPRATHLFSEPGAIEVVAKLAADWFRQHLYECPPSNPEQSGGPHAIS